MSPRCRARPMACSPYMRISYATDTASLTEACRRIQEFCRELHDERLRPGTSRPMTRMPTELHRPDRRLLGGISRLRHGRGWRGAGAAGAGDATSPGGRRALGSGARTGRVVGMVGTRPLGSDQAWEICRMYVAAAERGTGLAHRLLDTAEAHAQPQAPAPGALDRYSLRSRRTASTKSGLCPPGRHPRPGRPLETRSSSAMPSRPAGWWSRRSMPPPRPARSAGWRRSWLPASMPAPSSPICRRWRREVARDFWRKVATDVAADRRVLLAAWLDGVLVGTCSSTSTCRRTSRTAPRWRSCWCDPAARRAWLGRALMQRAEQAAQRLAAPCWCWIPGGRHAEPLYRAPGWQEAGRIPGFALDGTGHRACHASSSGSASDHPPEAAMISPTGAA